MNWHCTTTLQDSFTIDCMAVSANGEILACAGYDVLSIWHLPTRQRLHALQAHDDQIRDLALTANGHILISASASEPVSMGRLNIWDTQTGQALNTWEEKTCDWISVALHPNGNILAVGTDEYYGPPAIHLWNLDSFESLGTLAYFRGSIRSLTFSPDGETLAATTGCDVQLCNTSTGTILHTFSEHQDVVEHVIFNTDGSKLISSSSMDQTIRVWNLETGRQDSIIPLHDRCLSTIALNSTDQHLVSNSNQDIQLWDMTTNHLIGHLAGHAQSVTAVLFSQQKVISSSEDGSIKIWTQS